MPSIYWCNQIRSDASYAWNFQKNEILESDVHWQWAIVRSRMSREFSHCQSIPDSEALENVRHAVKTYLSWHRIATSLESIPENSRDKKRDWRSSRVCTRGRKIKCGNQRHSYSKRRIRPSFDDQEDGRDAPRERNWRQAVRDFYSSSVRE